MICNGYSDDALEDDGIFDNFDSTFCYSENFGLIKEAIARKNIQTPTKLEAKEHLEYNFEHLKQIGKEQYDLECEAWQNLEDEAFQISKIGL